MHDEVLWKVLDASALYRRALNARGSRVIVREGFLLPKFFQDGLKRDLRLYRRFLIVRQVALLSLFRALLVVLDLSLVDRCVQRDVEGQNRAIGLLVADLVGLQAEHTGLLRELEQLVRGGACVRSGSLSTLNLAQDMLEKLIRILLVSCAKVDVPLPHQELEHLRRHRRPLGTLLGRAVFLRQESRVCVCARARVCVCVCVCACVRACAYMRPH